eukprot:CAMPEP_0115141652 /NCGR_PEP_ID=MMETSP0227-20121206/59668_1 /TAXON_ID=89957 /ORGANISM="Polarella glacialis, Strain CCMP 1383" /LENGTH=73 /DNA_ID=CAMNT_0002550061 /DNA_START=284 /DNA_END=506 /DNA_ORIENTATION=+
MRSSPEIPCRAVAPQGQPDTDAACEGGPGPPSRQSPSPQALSTSALSKAAAEVLRKLTIILDDEERGLRVSSI